MTRRDRQAIAALAVAEMLVWCGTFYAFPALFVQFEAEFGWSKPALTGAITLAIVASALVSPLIGRMIDGGRGPLVLTGSALLGGFTMIGLVFVETLWQFYAVWLGIGLAMGGCLYEPAFAFMTRALGIHATRAITLVTLLGGLAGSISFPIGHYVSLAASWHAACLVYAALLFIAAPLLWFGAHHLERSIAAGDEADEAMPAPASGAHLRSARFWMLAAGFTLLAVNHGVVLNHILPLLAERGFDAATAVFAASMIGPMQVAGRIAVMFAAGRMPNRAIMMGCFTGIALATVLLIGSASLPLLIAGFVTLQGASYGVLSIIKPVVTREVMGGRNFGAISGTMAVPYLLGVAVAPFLGALVWQAGGYDLVLTAILGAALTGGLIAFGATRRTR